jgi:hypothetical protein
LAVGIASVIVIADFCGVVRAVPVMFKQEFPGGFNVSINNGPPTPSGPITIVGIVDTATADIYAASNYGEFPLTSVRFTGAGYLNSVINSPLSLLTYNLDGPTTYFGFQRRGEFAEGVTGWNGETLSGPFMSNLNSLATLVSLPYTTTGTSTYWYDGLGANVWTLAGGDTIGANIPNDGPNGTFSITAVPEPSTLLLLGIGAISLLGYRKRTR